LRRERVCISIDSNQTKANLFVELCKSTKNCFEEERKMKKIIVFALIACGMAVANSASADLVAQWDFSGNADDISGNGHHGTVYGATLTTDRFGNIASAYNFDGASSYIDVPNADSLNPTSAITITAWFKADSFALGTYSWPHIVDKSSNDPSGYYMLIAQVFQNNPCASFAVEPVGGVPSGVGTPRLEINTWYFAAGVYDGSTSTVKVYVGTSELSPLVVTSENGSGNIVPSSDNLNIGRDGSYPSSPERYFDGAIDDVRIYNNALTAEQVFKVYNAPEPATLLLLGTGGLALLRKRRAE
jgi:hypothetical protein